MLVTCNNCSHQFDVVSDHIPDEGTHLKCPKCATILKVVPEKAPQPTSEPPAPGWYLRKPDGKVYACPDFMTLDRWIRESKALPNDEVSQDGATWIKLDSIDELADAFTYQDQQFAASRSGQYNLVQTAAQPEQPKTTHTYQASQAQQSYQQSQPAPQQETTPRMTMDFQSASAPTSPAQMVQQQNTPHMTMDFQSTGTSTGQAQATQPQSIQQPKDAQNTNQSVHVTPQEFPRATQELADSSNVTPAIVNKPQNGGPQNGGRAATAEETGEFMQYITGDHDQASVIEHKSDMWPSEEVSSVLEAKAASSTGSMEIPSTSASQTTPNLMTTLGSDTGEMELVNKELTQPPIHRKTNEDLMAEALMREAEAKSKRRTKIILVLFILLVLGAAGAIAGKSLLKRPELTQDQKNALTKIRSDVNNFETETLESALEKAKDMMVANPDLPETQAALLQAYIASTDLLTMQINLLEAESKMLRKDFKNSDKDEQKRIVKEQKALEMEGIKLQNHSNDLLGKAGTIADTLSKQDHDIPIAYIAIADYLRSGGADKAGAAQRVLDKAKAKATNNPEYLYVKGALQATNADLREDAVSTLRMAWQKDPTMLKAAFKIAQIHIESAKFAKAKQVLEEVLATHPDNTTSLDLLGYLDSTIATKKITDDDAKSMSLKSLVEIGQKRLVEAKFEEARTIYSEGLERFPAQPDMLAGMAYVHLNTGKPDEAEILFEKALEVNPRHKTSVLGLGMTYMVKGDKKEAKKFFSDFIEWFPTDGLADQAKQYLDSL